MIIDTTGNQGSTVDEEMKNEEDAKKNIAVDLLIMVKSA
jgi:hypothetical protein